MARLGNKVERLQEERDFGSVHVDDSGVLVPFGDDGDRLWAHDLGS